MSVTVLQSPLFSRQKKKLHKNQIRILDTEIRKLCKNPKIGEQKKGDLKGVWIHKFKAGSQLFLVAYEWDANARCLIALGTHEGFYRDLKRYLR